MLDDLRQLEPDDQGPPPMRHPDQGPDVADANKRGYEGPLERLLDFERAVVSLTPSDVAALQMVLADHQAQLDRLDERGLA